MLRIVCTLPVCVVRIKMISQHIFSGLCRGTWVGLVVLMLGGCTLWSAVSGKAPGEPAVTSRVVEAPAADAGSEHAGAQGDNADGGSLFSDAQTHPAVREWLDVSIQAARVGPPPADYVVGPNDVLYVNVFGKPELGSPIVQVNNRVLGSRIDGAGRIQLPTLGPVYVAGMTVGQIQRKVQRLYEDIINKPWVVIEVLEHRSQPVYLIGRFNTPGVVYLDRPTTLVQALAHGDGFEHTAHLRGARLLRGDRVVPVDVYRLLREGAVEQNVWMQPNDTVYVPDEADQVVFVLGKVDKAGPFPMVKGRLTLTQALAAAGGFDKPGADLESVRIIRSMTPTRGELILVDFESILRGETLTFHLLPGDIVYVARNGLGDWNDTVEEILPTLQLFSGLLNPFVQIKFLSQ